MIHTLKIPQDIFPTAQSWPEFHQMVQELLEEGKATGPNQTEAFLNYTRQNMQRIRRVTRTTRFTEETELFFRNLQGRYHWLVISEGWCGDAAASLPVIHKLSELTDQLELRVTLRDEHHTLIDQFLTRGSRSIPMLIIMDAESGVVVGQWGPRPEELQQMMYDMKANGVPGSEVTQNLQLWYAKDKGRTIVAEISERLQKVEKGLTPGS